MKIFLDNIIYIELGELQPVVPPLGVKENYIVPSTKFEKKKKNNNNNNNKKDKLHANTQNCRKYAKTRSNLEKSHHRDIDDAL